MRKDLAKAWAESESRWHGLAIYIAAQAGDDVSVARIIQFYVPASFRKKLLTPAERRGKLIAFVKKSA
jgi:hypothetical protein